MMRRRDLIAASLASLAIRHGAAEVTQTPAVPPQPYFAALRRVIDALGAAGSPLPPDVERTLRELATRETSQSVVDAEHLLAPRVILQVTLTRDGDAVPEAGLAQAQLLQQGWRSFLVRILNLAGSREPLYLQQMGRVLGDDQRASSGSPAHSRQGEQTAARGLELSRTSRVLIVSNDRPPLARALSGLVVEYRVMDVFAFVAGEFQEGVKAGAFEAPDWYWWPSRTARLTLRSAPAREVYLRILDADGRTAMARIVVKDENGQVYPHRSGRIAPDMYFHDQVYRASGESLSLADGRYTLSAARGPEYHRVVVPFTVDSTSEFVEVPLRRWVDPSKRGWYSGDIHIHAAGCSHYNVPAIGVAPETIIRHVRGEDLWVGGVLTWGPGFEVQKEFFSGAAIQPVSALEQPEMQRARGVSLVPKVAQTDGDSQLRYDLETSGFPSSHTGHLILLGLREQSYPDTRGPPDWPSWSLPILRWAKAQGAVVGFAHCGSGLADVGGEIPSPIVPSFDAIGANEYLVDVAHGLVDFLSGGDTLPEAELTLWYHALNCGFRTPMAGETDWPCAEDSSVGTGRSYVRLAEPPRNDRGYSAWLAALRAGRAYMGDGRSHALDFRVNGASMGDELRLDRPGSVRLRATLAAWLDPQPDPEIREARRRGSWAAPRWHLERARLGETRDVTAEIVMNGRVIASRVIAANGDEHTISLTLRVPTSCWISLRILPSLHTNPVFISVAGKPIRASRASARWCLESLGVLERTQLPRIAAVEREAAVRAYAHARSHFERIFNESSVDDSPMRADHGVASARSKA